MKDGLNALRSIHTLPYRRPLAREVERFALRFLLFAPAMDLPLERFEILAVDGELMISRTVATCSSLRPSLRPISSADGTRFLITYVAMNILYG